MKKIRLFIFGLFALAVLVQTNSYGQDLKFYDGFTGTGNIGGNCATVGPTPDCASNGWLTHSGGLGTIDILPGSLDYAGLATSTGNKVYIIGASTLTRDVNAAVTGLSTVGYYSALIKVIDNTNLGATLPNYFMHFCSTAGNSGLTIFPARLGIKSVNSGANFRFSIMNTSGGTYSDWTADLNFGTVYLVVVKMDLTANSASLWVNPTSLGGAEPSGSVVNASSTTTTSALASICIRNGWDATNSAGTPKAEIDEIRVGITYASVTPTGSGIIEMSDINKFKINPNPSNGNFTIMYSPKTSYDVKIFNTLGSIVYEQTNIKSILPLDMSAMNKGIYFVQIKDSNSSAVATRKIVIQ